jgi:membrane dipeptidase
VPADIRELHESAIVVDTHADTFSRVLDEHLDFFDEQSGLAVNLPQMYSGGHDVQMFALYIAPGMPAGETVKRAMAMAGCFFRAVGESHGRLVHARTGKQLEDAIATGKKCGLLAIEGGHVVEGDLNVLRSFHSLGVVSMTLTHANSNDFADSSQGERRWEGLNDLGREVVAEMNRVGMIVDVSHTSDETVEAVLQTSRAPVIASHSCCKALCKHPRNLTDALMKEIASGGGVIHITYYPPYLDDTAADVFERNWELFGAELKRDDAPHDPQYMEAFYKRCMEGVPDVSLDVLCDHIDHAVALVGPDHVGIGSDWDGANITVKGLENSSRLPELTRMLVNRGYSESDIQKILGRNFIRVLKEVTGQ